MLLELTFLVSHYRDAETFTWEIGAGDFVHTDCRKVAAALGWELREATIRWGASRGCGVAATGFAKSTPHAEKNKDYWEPVLLVAGFSSTSASPRSPQASGAPTAPPFVCATHLPGCGRARPEGPRTGREGCGSAGQRERRVGEPGGKGGCGERRAGGFGSTDGKNGWSEGLGKRALDERRDEDGGWRGG